MAVVPAGANLKGHRHAIASHLARAANHLTQYLGHEGLVLKQCRAGRLVADLLCRASHIDVDYLGAPKDVKAGGLGEHGWIGASDLDCLWRGLSVVVDPPTGLLGGPEQGIGGGHLAHRVVRTEPFAELPKGTIGHTRHGCNEDSILNSVGPQLEWRPFHGQAWAMRSSMASMATGTPRVRRSQPFGVTTASSSIRMPMFQKASGMSVAG